MKSNLHRKKKVDRRISGVRTSSVTTAEKRKTNSAALPDSPFTTVVPSMNLGKGGRRGRSAGAESIGI